MTFREYIKWVLATILIVALLFTLWSTRGPAQALPILACLIVFAHEVYCHDGLKPHNVKVCL